jgi:hypothetical protein
VSVAFTVFLIFLLTLAGGRVKNPPGKLRDGITAAPWVIVEHRYARLERRTAIGE